ncbi:hypothetical protein [Rothia aeria]|uniref:hypothetical protein n=1 Tax=Rothia aeria TaxID=172042 RepID=UPI00288BA5A9|nr:hypothetical protein [Rothia aeria]
MNVEYPSENDCSRLLTAAARARLQLQHMAESPLQSAIIESFFPEVMEHTQIKRVVASGYIEYYHIFVDPSTLSDPPSLLEAMRKVAHCLGSALTVLDGMRSVPPFGGSSQPDSIARACEKQTHRAQQLTEDARALQHRVAGARTTAAALERAGTPTATVPPTFITYAAAAQELAQRSLTLSEWADSRLEEGKYGNGASGQTEQLWHLCLQADMYSDAAARLIKPALQYVEEMEKHLTAETYFSWYEYAQKVVRAIRANLTYRDDPDMDMTLEKLNALEASLSLKGANAVPAAVLVQEATLLSDDVCYWILPDDPSYALIDYITSSCAEDDSDSLQVKERITYKANDWLPLPPRYQGRLEWLRQTAFDRQAPYFLFHDICRYRLADQQVRESLHAAYPQIHASGPDSPQAVQALTEAIQAHIFCPLETLRHEHLRFMRKYS